VAEQTAAYSAVLKPFAGKPVNRPHAGRRADKPLAFLAPDRSPTRRWACAACGRFHPHRRAGPAAGGDRRGGRRDRRAGAVMAPMVATAERGALVRRAGARGPASRRFGVMIEVPAPR